MIVVECPDRCASNDQEARVNLHTVGNMGVMICHGQGSLRSRSASSGSLFILHV